MYDTNKLPAKLKEFLEKAPELEKNLFDLFTVSEIFKEFITKSDIAENYHIEYLSCLLDEQIMKLGEIRDIVVDINAIAEKKLEAV